MNWETYSMDKSIYWEVRQAFDSDGNERRTVGHVIEWPEGGMAFAAIATSPPLGVGPFANRHVELMQAIADGLNDAIVSPYPIRT